MNRPTHVSRPRNAFRKWPVWCFAAGCAATMLVALERGYEGTFYQLSTIMHHAASANAAFGYRLLLPFLAVQFQRIAHSLTDHNAFIATQLVAIVATVLLSGEWARLFLPRFGRPLGYALVTLMVCPTLDYWTFYDIAIVAVWTGCLLLLARGRLAWFVVLLALGTLNHENTLLLVPCAVAYCWPRIKLPRLIVFTLAQVGAWVLVRVLVIRLTPAGALYDNRVWDNLHFWLFYKPQLLFFAWVVLLPWWALAALGWKHSPYLLKCAALSLPGLFAVTFLFGKFDEARQFAAFTPACIGLIACWAQHLLENPTADERALEAAATTTKQTT